MRRRKDQGAAVLVSGGVESAALLAQALGAYERVYPLYVKKGLRWEREELAVLKRLLAQVKEDGLADLTILPVPVAAVYGAHWSVGSSAAPGFRAPDSAVYLPGRNLLLLSLGGLFCSSRRIPNLWIGTLKGNPFRDAQIGFLRRMEGLLRDTLGWPIRIAAPFRGLTKAQVIGRWPGLPWGSTLSCLRPAGAAHCGRCQKCAERKKGFKEAGMADPARFA
ncbi:MAG: 7-cyano-7-deazaguanine synthase [Candidatus Omnitrophica bacterium]|nr:7-cyano-7-deazaguanine synthase [Candidatus Omnitrophota bacterium]